MQKNTEKYFKKTILKTEEKLFLMPESLIDFMVEMNDDNEVSYLFADIFAYVIQEKEPTLSEGLGLIAFNHFRSIYDALEENNVCQ